MSRHHRLPRTLATVVVTAVAALTPVVGVHVATASTVAPRATTVAVLGSPHHDEPYGQGWGVARPSYVFNGGDPSGSVSDLTWTGWGGRRAYGHGLNPMFRPGGGYYREPGQIVLRAQSLGPCADGTFGYRQLRFRVASRPGGPLGLHWHRWGGDGDICRRF